MSSYANYTEYSKTYDEYRGTHGIELYYGTLACKLKKPVSEMCILDAGCGTGNYSKGLLQLGVGKMTMLDANEGMLEQARKKLAEVKGFQGRYEIIQGELPKLPFGEEVFDGVMVNNVVHHLAKVNPDGVTADKTSWGELLQQCFRVLKSGGVLFILDTFVPQAKGIWYWHLNLRVSKMMKSRGPAYDEMYELLKSTGFRMESLQTFSRIEGYPSVQNFEGIFDKEIRDSSSWFSEFTAEETDEMLSRLTKMKENGTLEEFFHKCDAGRKEVGQMTFMIVFK